LKAKDIIIGLIFLAAIVLVFVVLFSIPSGALSDETQEQVEDLRMKHYGLTSGFLYVTDDTLFYRPQEYEWWSVTFDDGILYVETQDGTWFIEMQRKEE